MKIARLKPVAEGRCAQTLSDLPGTTGDVKAAWAKSVSHAMSFIREDFPITASGDCGAIVVWKDDEGWWRCEFMVHRQIVAKGRYKYKAAVHQSLRDHWPKMRRSE